MNDVLIRLGPDVVVADLRASSKSEALRVVARHAAKCVQLPEEAVHQTLLHREALGTTAIGRGVAIPHAVVAGLTDAFSLFARARSPLAFDAADGVPVSFVYLLLSPPDQAAQSTHLLAAACRALRDPAVRNALEAAADDRSLRTVLDWALYKRPRL
jgi:PTS system nitrogen regulatory IIA component